MCVCACRRVRARASVHARACMGLEEDEGCVWVCVCVCVRVGVCARARSHFGSRLLTGYGWLGALIVFAVSASSSPSSIGGSCNPSARLQARYLACASALSLPFASPWLDCLRAWLTAASRPAAGLLAAREVPTRRGSKPALLFPPWRHCWSPLAAGASAPEGWIAVAPCPEAWPLAALRRSIRRARHSL